MITLNCFTEKHGQHILSIQPDCIALERLLKLQIWERSLKTVVLQFKWLILLSQSPCIHMLCWRLLTLSPFSSSFGNRKFYKWRNKHVGCILCCPCWQHRCGGEEPPCPAQWLWFHWKSHLPAATLGLSVPNDQQAFPLSKLLQM